MNKTMKEIVEGFQGLKVVVLGDLMLDRYTWGRATRISQEAPVPVVLVERQDCVPGGAANVVRNVLSLRGAAVPVGLVGEDEDGRKLMEILVQAGALPGAVLPVPGGVTTVKTRILAGSQQVVRVDREVPAQVMPDLREKLLGRLDAILSAGDCQALILEDYAKGVFSGDFMEEAVDLAARHGVFTSLDPHPADSFNVRGIRLMTPNRSEAFAMAGMPQTRPAADPLADKALLAVGERLQSLWQPELLLITLGAEGMILFERDKERPLHIPTQARQVVGVSGAGDTVMATMTLALLAGAPPEMAARIANYAAGIVVGYVGTRAIEADALLNRVQECKE